MPASLCSPRGALPAQDARGNMKDSLAPPWFFKESPGFYTWIRET